MHPQRARGGVYYEADPAIAVGNGGLAGLVLAYALLGHRQRRNAGEWEDIEESGTATTDSGL